MADALLSVEEITSETVAWPFWLSY